MFTRKLKTQAIFTSSFGLSSVEGRHPAGTYDFDAEDEQMASLPFQAADQLTLLLHLRPQVGACGEARADHAELADALAAVAA